MNSPEKVIGVSAMPASGGVLTHQIMQQIHQQQPPNVQGRTTPASERKRKRKSVHVTTNVQQNQVRFYLIIHLQVRENNSYIFTNGISNFVLAVTRFIP